MTQKVFSLALDGPAGAGKSTVAKGVAAQMDAVCLDTGAMYRTMGLYMSRRGLTKAEDIARAAGEPRIEVTFEGGNQHMLLDGEDVTDILRTPSAGMLASNVSAVPEVRTRLVALQRQFAEGHRVVMDGRDIGTEVLPHATLKIFLTASAEERARRRCADLKRDHREQPYEQVLAEIRQRDYNDSHRAVSPMRQAEDAVLLDSSKMTQEEVVAEIVRRLREAIG